MTPDQSQKGEKTTGWRAVLGLPSVYSAVQNLLGANRVRHVLTDQYLKPTPGMRVLDIGCGPADMLNFLPDVTYVGIDHSESYIEAARAQFGDRGTFRVGDAAELQSDEAPFDLVLAIGLLHHMTDAQVQAFVSMAAKLMKPTGRFVSLDPCYSDEQSNIARAFIKRDRGQFVRQSEGYRQATEGVFAHVHLEVRHDLARMPYSHAIMISSLEPSQS